jgi:hypothetical protein
MTQQAAQFGQNLPGLTVNALQSAYTGLGGAENAVLGQLNTGANLLNTVPNFGNAAANANKNPLTGQQSNSQGGSQQSSQGKGNQQQPKQPTDGSSGKGSQTPPWDPVANANATRNKGDLPDIPGAGTQNKEDQNQDNTPAGVLPDWLTSLNNDPSLARGDPFGLGSPDQATSPDNTNWPSATFSDGLQFPAGTGQGAGTNPNGVSSNVDQFNMGSFPQDQGGQQQSSGNDNPWTSNQFGQDSSGNWGGGDFSNSDLAAQAGINDIGSGFNGGDYTPPPSDTGDPNGGFSGGDYSGGGFSGGDYSGGGFSGGDYSGGYAAGGVIPNRTTGGPVPRNASPSGGRQTDDIPARLNANEFVIPRDVKEHMGTKYFTDLIAKSRKARTGMAGPPPRGKMKPALRMRPTFTSNYMGNR